MNLKLKIVWMLNNGMIFCKPYRYHNLMPVNKYYSVYSVDFINKDFMNMTLKN